MEEICDITVTADDRDWLVGFVRGLVEDRLVACGNVTVTPVRSIYRWDGAVEEADEVAVVLHTRRSLADQVVARTEAEHPYDTPQVLVVPVVGASAGYHRWVLESTAEPVEPG
ncbi:MAG TPA: divalent-cation tolerance protein CutA [Acidimicrobiales bacterium]